MKTALQLTLILVLLTIIGFAQKSPNDFVFTIKTDNPGVTNDSAYQLRLDVGVNYNVDIDWDNDGSFDTLGVNSTINHQYSSTGSYTMRLRGTFPSIYLGSTINNFNTDAKKLVSVDQWGDQVWTFMDQMFLACDSLVALPTDTPNLSQVTTMNFMFKFSSSFQKGVAHWDVSNVTSMISMFDGAFQFNDSIGSWDVSNVSDMRYMFKAATSFNQPLNAWDVSNVTNMERMFLGATAFNQSLNAWDVSNVTNMEGMFNYAINFNESLNNWDVSSVIDMNGMFERAWSFNQPLYQWDVSNVSEMRRVFYHASSFNQPLTNWSFASFNTNNIYNLSQFLSNSGLSTSNYDSLLIHWYTNYPSLNANVGAHTLEFCQASAQRDSLIASGWTFLGDTLDSNCQLVGLEEDMVKQSKFLIYPIPSSDYVTILAENLNGERLRIFNTQGQLVKELQLNTKQTSLDVRELPNGIYFMQGKGISEKLVVQH
ncbi:MAG: BspA family leucine-rich repeat surface protein [Vicingaceae bacterium]